MVWLAASKAAGESTGGFWFDRARRPARLLPFTGESPEERRELWVRCGQDALIGS